MSGITFDTGALIALERNRQRIVDIWKDALQRGTSVTAPAPVVAEWWKGRTDLREKIALGLRIEPFDFGLAKTVGLAMAAVTSASIVDTIVMASAARRGDVVYTSDVADLERIRRYFPSVRVLGT